MKTSAWTYIRYYSLAYLVLSVIYGVVQWLFVCTEMKGFECNFNETKFIGFLTIVAYILTPIVAIFGFISWKDQHNKKINSDYYQDALNTLKNVSESVNELKRLSEEADIDSLEMGKSYYIKCLYDINTTSLNELNKLQGTLIFIDTINKNKDLESVFFAYILKSRSLIKDIEKINLFDENYDDVKNMIKGLALNQGLLISNKIKQFIEILHNNIKA